MKSLSYTLIALGFVSFLSAGCEYHTYGEQEIRILKEHLHSAPQRDSIVTPTQISGDETIMPTQPETQPASEVTTGNTPAEMAGGTTGGTTGGATTETTPGSERPAPASGTGAGTGEATMAPRTADPSPPAPECTQDSDCTDGKTCTLVDGLNRCATPIFAVPPTLTQAPATPVAPATPAAGTVTLAARASNGDLLLWRSSSEAAHAWSHYGIRSYRLPMGLGGSPTILYQPESKGAPGTGGRLHIFGRSLTGNQLAYRWCDINQFGDGENAYNCQGPGPLAFRLRADSNPSVVLLKDGTLMGFYQNDGGQMGYFKGQGGGAGFREGSTIVGQLRDSREQGSCNVVWYSPSAVVKTDDAGNEEIDVIARDGDWFHGHALRAYLPNAQNFVSHPEIAENKWRCEIFNGSNGASDTGREALGSSPVAVLNGRTHQIDLIGKEHAGGNQPILWMTGTDRPSGRMYLQPSQVLANFSMNYPLDQVPAVAVEHDDRPDRILNVFFRTDRGGLGWAYLMGDGRLGYSNHLVEYAHPMTNNSPAAVSDPSGNTHVFAVEQNGSHLLLRSYNKTFEANHFQADFAFPVDAAATDGALAAVYTPEAHVAY